VEILIGEKMNGKFPDWAEWRGLSDEQREYELYRVLSFLSEGLDSTQQKYARIKENCNMQVGDCGEKFRGLENEIKEKKLWDRTAATFGGAIGGALAYLGIKMGG
jgi:hypothetical protein